MGLISRSKRIIQTAIFVRSIDFFAYAENYAVRDKFAINRDRSQVIHPRKDDCIRSELKVFGGLKPPIC